ncbi:MAG: hypothetical protein Q9161_006885 [Pseudevernia consocians]
MLQLHREDEDIQPVFEERVCIIKESWYIMITNGCYGIRVDHVSDVTWLPKADGRMALEWRPQSDGIAITATQLKDNGNDARKMGKQLRPSNLKLSSVAPTSEEAHIIRLNRSLPDLISEYFDKALDDAGEFTAEAIDTDKGLCRAARSFYELGSFQERHTVLDNLFEVCPGCDATKKELRRTKDRLREEDQGDLNCLAMLKATAERNPPGLEITTLCARFCTIRGRG